MKYNLHKMISLNVEPDVSNLVVESIDRQIEHFKNPKDKQSIKEINVKSYNKKFFNFNKKHKHSIMLIKNSRKYLVYPSMELAYEKTNKGFNVYVNYPNFPVTFLIQYLLVKTKSTLVHSCGAVDSKGKVTLFPSGCGVGKTVILMDLVKNHNYHLVGDDLVILNDKGKCFSYPRYVGIKDYFETGSIPGATNLSLKKLLTFKTKRLIIENAPFVGLFKKFLFNKGLSGKIVRKFSTRRNLDDVPLTQIYGKDVIVDSGELKEIICLQKTSKNIKLEKVTKDFLCNFMFFNTFSEWLECYKPILLFSAIGVLDLYNYFDEVKKIIYQATPKSGWLLSVPVKMDSKKIYKTLKSKGLVE